MAERLVKMSECVWSGWVWVWTSLAGHNNAFTYIPYHPSRKAFTSSLESAINGIPHGVAAWRLATPLSTLPISIPFVKKKK